MLEFEGLTEEEFEGANVSGSVSPSVVCQHPSPVLATTLHDPAPTWHCSGCDQMLTANLDGIRAAEARGHERATVALADSEAELARLREGRDELEDRLNELNDWANALAKALDIPDDLDPFFGIDRVAREQVRWLAEAEGRDVALPWQNKARTMSVAAFHSADEGPLVGDRIESGGLYLEAWLTPDAAYAKAAALMAAAREATQLADASTEGKR